MMKKRKSKLTFGRAIHKTRPMHELKREIVIGSSAFELECELLIDGVLERRFKCESFVANMLRILFVQMSGDPTGTDVRDSAAAAGTVTGATNATPIVLTITGLSNVTDRDALDISGVGGNTNANGRRYIKNVGANQWELYSDPDLLTAIAGNGAYTSGGTGWHRRQVAPDIINYRSAGAAADDTLGIVLGTGTTAVDIDDGNVETKILTGSTSGKLTYNAQTFAVPGVDSTTSQFTITRTFTNNSGGTISPSEICLLVNYGLIPNVTGKCMLTRDVISPITVLNGKTLTVNLKLKCVLGASGGFVRAMIDILYRMVTNNGQSILMTTNSSVSDTAQPRHWFVAIGGGRGEPDYARALAGPAAFDQMGILVGTDNTAVSTSDYKLGARIPEGKTTGRFLYSGVACRNIAVDSGTDIATFDIERFFENKSGGSIVVKEWGVAVSLSRAGEGALILREALSSGDWVTVADTELLKATITVKLIL